MEERGEGGGRKMGVKEERGGRVRQNGGGRRQSEGGERGGRVGAGGRR